MKYIIVGAVAGGASTAARIRRLDEQAEIIIFEKGEYISYANCGLPYYIGDVSTDAMPNTTCNTTRNKGRKRVTWKRSELLTFAAL